MDFLSEILEKINKTFGVEISEENKVNLVKVLKQMNNSEPLIKVMVGDNSEQNKKMKIGEIYKNEILSFVNNHIEFYKEMEKPQMVNLLTNLFYNNFQQRNNLF